MIVTKWVMKVLLDCVDVDLLADCQIWLATHPEAQNDFYNISNGDTFRFQQVQYQLIPLPVILTHTATVRLWHLLQCLFLL